MMLIASFPVLRSIENDHRAESEDLNRTRLSDDDDDDEDERRPLMRR